MKRTDRLQWDVTIPIALESVVFALRSKPHINTHSPAWDSQRENLPEGAHNQCQRKVHGSRIHLIPMLKILQDSQAMDLNIIILLSRNLDVWWAQEKLKLMSERTITSYAYVRDAVTQHHGKCSGDKYDFVDSCIKLQWIMNFACR